MITPATILHPETCRLESPLFNSFPSPLFRRSEDDGIPVLVVRLGNRDAVIPLRGLQTRMGIADNSPDGRMLNHIGAALEFVDELRPGDPLPTEILNGEASWEPDPVHLHIAAHRLRGQLVNWLRLIGTASENIPAESDFDRAGYDPILGERLHAAFSLVAAQIQLPSALDAIALLNTLARELAYIEALRERLLFPIRNFARKLDFLSRGKRPNNYNFEIFTQVRRLCNTGLTRIGARFSAVDFLTDNLLHTMHHGEAQRLRLRSDRDWLYRMHRAFAPILAEWENAPHQIDEDFWHRLARTYRFLAPRFMAVQEWKTPQFGPPGHADNFADYKGNRPQNPAPGRAR